MSVHNTGPVEMGYQLPYVTRETWAEFGRQSSVDFAIRLEEECNRNPELPTVRDELVEDILSYATRADYRPVPRPQYELVRQACQGGANHVIVLLAMQTARDKTADHQQALPIFSPEIMLGFKATRAEELRDARSPDRLDPTGLSLERYREINPALASLAEVVKNKYRSSDRRLYLGWSALHSALQMARLVEFQGHSDYLRIQVGEPNPDG